eukprot:166896_1
MLRHDSIVLVRALHRLRYESHFQVGEDHPDHGHKHRVPPQVLHAAELGRRPLNGHRHRLVLDGRVLESVSVFGIVLVCSSSLCDALVANFEEMFLCKKHSISRLDIIFFSSYIGSIYNLIFVIVTGELFVAIQHAISHPEVIYLGILSAFINYGSLTCTIMMIIDHGATCTEVVKCIRKVVTVSLSFYVFSKPLSNRQMFGLLLFTGALGFGGTINSIRRLELPGFLKRFDKGRYSRLSQWSSPPSQRKSSDDLLTNDVVLSVVANGV